MSSIRRVVAYLGSLVDLRDLAYFGGLALVSWGAYLAWPPLAPVVAGVGLIRAAR